MFYGEYLQQILHAPVHLRAIKPHILHVKEQFQRCIHIEKVCLRILKHTRDLQRNPINRQGFDTLPFEADMSLSHALAIVKGEAVDRVNQRGLTAAALSRDRQALPGF